MSTDKNTIKNWFKTSLKPTQAQFWATWDSFWHKDEKLPISSIDGLGGLLDGKAEANHTHTNYATNDATSLTAENVTAWQNKLGVADLKFDDKAITITQDYSDFGLQAGASINAFNNAIYSEVAKKLDVPTENATNSYVLMADGSVVAKSEFGKVDKVMGVAPDTNKNVDISGVAMNWTNPSQRFSALPDKSADETYELFALFDSDGNLAKASNVANAFEASLTTASVEQRLKIGKLLNVGVIHVGFIQDYYGDVTELPVGWSLCDGTNGTPDLRGMFIIGYDPRDDEYNEIGKTGGAKEVTLKLHQMPVHNHSGTTSIDGVHTHEYLSVQDQGNQYFGGGSSAKLSPATTSEAGGHSHSFYTSPTGGGMPHENRPPFYVLAKIMYTG
ncbi:phage baseplate protein [Empedobacter sp. UBA5637]|uniref:phage baseplate protein n=1 Tax=Empedobacter sp. UBA5637 TaxID=1946442 RepID=UPI0025BD21C2|nr:hypothetical protein [Empedobacter sp. UBA5637]